VTLYYYVFGTVAVDTATFRYFTPICVFGLIIAAVFGQEMSFRYGAGLSALTFFICVPFVAWSCADLVYPSLAFVQKGGASLQSGFAQNPKQGIVDAAKRSGLTYGYATFWNAGAVTVLASAGVRVVPVQIVPNMGLVPMRYLDSEWWYEPRAHRGPVFVFVADAEMGSVTREFFDEYVGRPDQVIRAGDGFLLIFPENIAISLPYWRPQRKISQPLPVSDRRAQIDVSDALVTTMPDGRGAVTVKIKNVGKSVFASDGSYPILIGAHLKDKAGKLLNYDFLHVPLANEVLPGESGSTRVRFKIPSPGQYIVDLDVLQGAVSWFADNGSRDMAVTAVYPSPAGSPRQKE
jgi:hypothetical protein